MRSVNKIFSASSSSLFVVLCILFSVEKIIRNEYGVMQLHIFVGVYIYFHPYTLLYSCSLNKRMFIQRILLQIFYRQLVDYMLCS